MDDRGLAQHRAGHGRGQCQPRAGCGSGDQRGVEGTLAAPAPGHHSRIAGCFLVAPHCPPAEPSQGVEPVQRQHRLRGKIGQQIVPAMVRQLVCDGEIARLSVRLRHEEQRQRHHLVAHAERHGSADHGSLDQTDAADFAHRPRIGEHVTPHLAIGGDAPGEKHRRPPQPQRHQHVAPAERQQRLGHGRGSRRGSGGGQEQRFGPVGERRRIGLAEQRKAGWQHQRRHQQAQEGQCPQRIGHLSPKGARDRAAQQQQRADEQAGVEGGVDQPLDHERNSLRSRSISAMSSLFSASASASWANRAAGRPPNSRSTIRRDSPPR